MNLLLISFLCVSTLEWYLNFCIKTCFSMRWWGKLPQRTKLTFFRKTFFTQKQKKNLQTLNCRHRNFSQTKEENPFKKFSNSYQGAITIPTKIKYFWIWWYLILCNIIENYKFHAQKSEVLNKRKLNFNEKKWIWLNDGFLLFASSILIFLCFTNYF